MRRLVSGFLLLGGVLACAHAGAPVGQTIGLRVEGTSGVQATIRGNEIIGPNISIERTVSGYRGRVLQAPVQLDWKETQVTGVVSAGPVKLTWTPEGDGIRIRGLYAGILGDAAFSATALNGRLGPCSYSLKGTQYSYEGFQSCGGPTLRTTVLVLPADLGTRPVGEQVALLALMLTLP